MTAEASRQQGGISMLLQATKHKHHQRLQSFFDGQRLFTFFPHDFMPISPTSH
jgi:hypothetical protein